MNNCCEEKCRQNFIDKLRVAAACAVVMLHTVTGVTDTVDMALYPFEYTVFLVIIDWITWCVPVFVMISGYLFLNPAKKITVKDMLVKYCRRIVLALLVFGVPYACLEQIMNSKSFELQMVGKGFLMVLRGQSWSHMWYLYMILILYLITPLLKWILQRIPAPVLYLILVCLGVGSSVLPFLKKLFAWESLPVLPDGGIYLFYYICGYLFGCRDGQRKNESNTLSSAKRKWAMKVAWTGVVCLLVGMACSRIGGSYMRMAYNYPFCVILSLLLVWIVRERDGNGVQKNTTLWRKLGGLCFAVYLVHPVFLNLLYKLLRISILDFPIWISLPVIYLSVLAMSLLTAWILCKIPVLKKYVL